MASRKENSQDLINIGKFKDDPLLITREKPFRFPTSSALSRVKAFLPQIDAANQSLDESSSSATLDIENVSDDGPFIEMNLALFERGDSSDSEDEINIVQSSSDSDDDDVIEIGHSEVTAKNFHLPKSSKGRKPEIEVMDTFVNERTSEGANNVPDNQLENKLFPKDSENGTFHEKNGPVSAVSGDHVQSNDKENKKKVARTRGQKSSSKKQTSTRKSGKRQKEKRK